MPNTVSQFFPEFCSLLLCICVVCVSLNHFVLIKFKAIRMDKWIACDFTSLLRALVAM